MYEEKVEFDDSRPFNSICCACLCRTRKTVPLGEYAGIFKKIIYISVDDKTNLNVCWECLAVLKKFKVFETKCYIAQKELRSKREHHKQQKCLSTLVTTPVKIDVYFGDLSDVNHGFKFEEKPIVSQSNLISNNELYESYDNNKTNEVYYCTKFEETAPLEEHLDNGSDNDYYEYINKSNGIDDSKVNGSDLNVREINKNVVIKTDIAVDDKVVRESKTSNECNTNTNSSLSKEIKNYLNNKSTRCKINRDDKSVRRKGLRKKDLEEHFRIVGIKSKDMKRFRSKFKIDASEMEFWRERERAVEFYVDKPYKCHYCICGFSSLKKKYEHDKMFHDSQTGVYTCDICTAQFVDKHQLAVHVSKHYQMHRCNLCQFRCISRHVIKWHMRRHKRLVLCVHCDACFANVGLFHKHFKSNHSVFICDHCGKKCRTKYTLEKHMRHHSETNVCVICNKVYASRNSLRNHSEMKHRHTSGEMSYCVKCDKQFPNVPLYRRHVQSSKAHAAERDADRCKKQVSCPICGNVYSRKTYMMNHYRHVHMKQSKHYCSDCDRHFLNRTRYVEHRKYHHEGETKAKNKMCNICGRGFAANRTLVNHIRTHSGERPYECQYCDAKFTQKHGMLSHIKYIHMKNKRRAFQ